MEYLQILQEKIKEITDDRKSAHINAVILPSVLMDFQKMLLVAKPKEIISETYHLDDGSLTLGLKGRRLPGAVPPQVTEVTLNENIIYKTT